MFTRTIKPYKAPTINQTSVNYLQATPAVSERSISPCFCGASHSRCCLFCWNITVVSCVVEAAKAQGYVVLNTADHVKTDYAVKMMGIDKKCLMLLHLRETNDIFAMQFIRFHIRKYGVELSATKCFIYSDRNQNQ